MFITSLGPHAVAAAADQANSCFASEMDPISICLLDAIGVFFSSIVRFDRSGGLAGSEDACRVAICDYSEDEAIHKVVDAVGGLNTFCKLPALKWDQRFIQTFGQIRVEPEDMSAPLMRGIDEYGRAYLAIKKEMVDDESHRTYAETQFRRGSSGRWVCAVSEYETADADIEELRRLVRGETVETSKLYLPEIDGSEKECLTAFAKYPDGATTIRKVADAVGGIESFCQLPVLRWQERFRGNSPNSIHLSPDDLSAPMMRGMDSRKKPFFAVKTAEGDRVNAEVLFQQHYDTPEPWVSSSFRDRLAVISGEVDERELDQLSQLAKGETITINRPFSSAEPVGVKLHGAPV